MKAATETAAGMTAKTGAADEKRAAADAAARMNSVKSRGSYRCSSMNDNNIGKNRTTSRKKAATEITAGMIVKQEKTGAAAGRMQLQSQQQEC
jgi:hypothetical protein